MAPRSWVTSICTAIGVAVGAGAAQLGVGYGLSVIAWVPAAEDSSRSLWLGSLAWVAWLAANSTIIGALVADRLGRRDPDFERSQAFDIAWRTVIALAAAVGALIVVPLVAVPARFAQQANNSAPQYTAGGYAVVGVAVGLIGAIGALNARAVAANVIATAAWLWGLAAAAIVHGLQIGASVGSAQLATWQFPDARWVRGMVNLPGALLMLGAALLIGAGAAWTAGRRGDHRVGVAVSGAIGPTLVAAAYFLAVPGLGGEHQQLSAYVTAPYAVIAGLAGSVLVSAIGAKGSRERSRLERDAREAEEHDAWSRAMSGADGTDNVGQKPTRAKTARAKAAQAKAGQAGTTGQTGTGQARTTRSKQGSSSSDVTATSGSGPASTDQDTEDGAEKRSGSISARWSSLIHRRSRDNAKASGQSGSDSAGSTAASTSTSPSTSAAQSAPVEPLWPDEARPSNRKRRGSR